MGTTTTSGTVTSFANTPQAGDDIYLATLTGLTEDSTCVVVLNVMANDLGGAAKTLYSLDDASSAGSTTAPTDLLAQDTVRAEATSTDTSLGGARIWITADGKVGYDAATLSAAFRAQLQSLNAGQTLNDTFAYAIRLGNGTLSWATVTVQFAGANDAPVVAAVVAGTAAEDGAIATLDALANASDVDSGAVLSVVNVPATLPAGVTWDAATHSFKLDPSDSAYQHLAVGGSTVVTVNYGVSDGIVTTPASVSFTVSGTNDAPTVTAALTAAGTEGGAAVTANLLAGAGDVDDGEAGTLTVSNVMYRVDGGAPSASAPAGFSLSGSTLTVDPTNAAFDHLKAGATTQVVVSYLVKDAQGATVAQTETVTITGTNDAPTVTGALSKTAAEGAASFTANLLSGAGDVDDGETATLSIANVTYRVDGGADSSAAPAGFSLSGSTLTVDPTNPAFDHLDVGAHTTVVVSYDVQDAQGATVAQTETVTITGTNDIPTVTGALTATAAEGASSFTANLLAGASDLDDGETATLSISDVTYSVDGLGASGTPPAGFSLSGSTLAVDPTNTAFDHLKVGTSTTVVVAYNVKDAQGATVAQTETVTITGTNDVPTVTGALSETTAEGAASFTANLLSGASDVDDGETATLSIANVTYRVDGGADSSAAPAGFSLSGSTVTVDPTNPAFDHLAVGAHTTVVVAYDVKDAQGATVAQTETITITGTNDVPTVTGALSATAAEGAASFTANLLSGASDLDDGETATLSVHDVTYAVDGGAASPTAPTGFSVSGSILTVDPTNAAFDHLAVGAHTTIVVAYNVKDAQGAIVAQTETVTITGTNDVPTVTGVLSETAAEGATSFTANLLSGASDLDDGETATLSISNVSYSVDGGTASATAPAGFSLSGSVLTVDPTNTAFDHLKVGASTVVTVGYLVKDAQGATVAQTETVTITGTNDVPTVAGALSATAAEGAPAFTANLLSGASDVDDGETATLSIANVSYSVDGGTATAAAPAGFSLSGSTLTVDPTNVAFDHLAVGASTMVVIAYNVKDVQGATVSQTETVTITGTNDVPTVTGVLTETAAEGAPSFTANLLSGASDLDDGETATLSIANVTYAVDGAPASATAPAGFSLSGSTLTVNPTSTAFDHLKVGASTVVVVSYLVKDAQGATVAQTETVTISGTNDVPTVTGALSQAAAEGAASFTASLLAGASDADDGETATLSIANVSYSVDGGTASATAPAGFGLSGSTLTVDPTNAAFNHLKVGASTVVVVGYNVKDAQGATVSQTETVTITGTNDAPAVTAALTATAAEGASSFAANLLAGASDPDDGETLTLSVANVKYAVDGGGASATAPAGFGVSGSTLTVDPANGAFNHLAVGASTTVVVSYDVKDAQGATAAQTDTVTITGTNDGPLVAAALSATVPEGSSAFAHNLLSGASDPDDGETATLAVSGVSYSVDGGLASATAPTGFSLSGTSLAIDPSNTAFDSLAAGQDRTVVVSYTVKDTHNATVAQTDTIHITGVNDAPVLNAAATPVLAAVDENAGSPVGAVGTLVSALIDPNPPATGLNNVSDADSGALTGIALTGTDSANGVWWYSTNGGTNWALVGSVSTASALLLAADANTRLYFQGNTNFYGTIASGVTFRAWDETSGTAGGHADTTINGATSAFSTATDTAAITVNHVNVNPVASADVIYVSNATAVTLPTSALLANDTDIDGLSLSITSMTAPAGALATPITLNPDGTFSFTTGATGGTVAAPTLVTLTYSLSDGAGGTATGTVALRVVDTTSAANTVDLSAVAGYQASYIDGKAGGDTLSDGSSLSSLLGGSGNDQLNGNAGNDLLVGGDNNDALNGGAGNDVLRGGQNNDDIDGGAGTEDLIDFSDATGPNGIVFALTQSASNTTFNTPGSTGLGTDTYRNIEGVVGTNFDDTLTGSASGDIIRGGGGSDTIDGLAGTDLIDFSDATGGISFVLVQSSSATTFAAPGLGTDSYKNIEGVIGTSFADSLTGTAAADQLRGGGGNDTINGLGGNDRISGGSGADTLTGGAGADTFVFDTAPNAVDTITDFEADLGDKIELSAAVFANLSTGPGTALAAADFASVSSSGATASVAASVHVIFDSATGNLYYDADGGSSANRTLFATLTGLTGTFDQNDIQVGN